MMLVVIIIKGISRVSDFYFCTVFISLFSGQVRFIFPSLISLFKFYIFRNNPGISPIVFLSKSRIFVISSNFDFFCSPLLSFSPTQWLWFWDQEDQKIDEIITRILAHPPFSFCHLGSVCRADIPLLLTFNGIPFIFSLFNF